MTDSKPFDAELKRQAIEQIQAGFADPLFEIALLCSAPIYWFEVRGGRPLPPLNSGTVTFVDAGAGPFAITADHVYRGYLDDRASLAGVNCQISSELFDPEDRLISRSTDADLATFCLDSGEIASMSKLAHGAPLPWPPTPPPEGSGIFLGGYPGHERSVMGDAIEWGFARGLEVATAPREDRLSIVFNRENWVCQDRQPTPEVGYRWGGVSGGPVFELIQKPLISWRLCAIVTEFSQSFEILFASALARVRADGSID